MQLPSADMSQPLPNGQVFVNSCAHPQAYSSTFPISDRSTKAVVFKQDYPRVDEVYASQIASRFGIEAVPQLADGALFSGSQAYKVKDESGFVSIDTETGYIVYASAKSSRQNTDAISDDQAQALARDFLDTVGMLPGNDTTAEVQRFPYYLEIRLEMADAPMPEGQTAVKVELAGDGQVRGLTYKWSSINSIGSYPIISEAAAFERLRDCGGYVHEGIPYPEIKVASAKLVYIGFPLNPRPDYLMPVYEFSTDDPDVFWNAWVPAVADEYVAPVTPAATATRGP